MSKSVFEGFEVPGTTPVPDIVFDELLSELTGNELKVLLYIIRRTYGFGKNADAISLSQFRKGITTKDEKVLDKGCGIEHNRTILVALASLEGRGYVIAHKRQTKIGDADTTIYRLHFKEASKAVSSDGVVTSGNHVVTSDNYGSLSQVTTGSYSTSRRVVTSSNLQETVLQETDSQEESNSKSTASNAFASSLSLDAALSQENENDSHSDSTGLQEMAESLIVPPATGTTHPQGGDTDGTNTSHPRTTHLHSRESGIDRVADRDGSQADNPAHAAEQCPSRDNRQEAVALQEGDTGHDHPHSHLSDPGDSCGPVESTHHLGQDESLPAGAQGERALAERPLRGEDDGDQHTALFPPTVEPGRSDGPTPVAPVPAAASVEDRGAGRAAVSGALLPASPPVRQDAPPLEQSQVHVLVVTQQFTSIEEWKEGQDAFLKILSAVWRTANADFKQTYGNWNGYRKQYLDRWLRANPKPAEELPADVQRILDDWKSLHKKVIPITKSDIDAAGMLAPCNPTREELGTCRKWIFTTDDPKKPWYRKIGVSLLDVAKNWSKWQSLQEPERGEEPTTRTLTREELRRMPV